MVTENWVNIGLGNYLQVSQPSITVIGLKSTHLKFHYNLTGHNELRSEQIGGHFADSNINCSILDKKCILIQIPTTVHFMGLTDDKSGLVWMMAWRK